MQTLAVVAAVACLAASPKAPGEARPVSPKAPVAEEETGTGAEPEPGRPFVPIVNDELLLYRRRWISGFRLGVSLAGGGRVRRDLYYGVPRGPCFFDPAHGYYYYPRQPSTWIDMGVEPLGRPGAQADRGQAKEMGAPGVRARSEPGQGAFGSQLAPMLGGPRTVGLAFAVGEVKLRQGRFGEAIQAFNRAARDEPDDAVPKIALSLAFAAAGAYAPGAHVLREGLGAMADWDVLDLKAGEVFGGAERYAAVEGRLAEAVRADPSNEDVQLLLGFLHLATRSHAEAVETLGAARDIDAPASSGPADPFISKLLLAAHRHLRPPESNQNPEPN